MINERIKELRIAAGINQMQLGAKLGVTKQCVSNWENDNVLPSIEMLIKMASFFQVSADYLLGLENNKTIDVSGLSDKQIAHIRLIISDFYEANNISY